MSEWDQWVAFVLGHGANNYFEIAPKDSPSVWHIQIGSFEGKIHKIVLIFRRACVLQILLLGDI